MICSFVYFFVSSSEIMISLIFLIIETSLVRNWFRTSCCVMVLAPCISSPSVRRKLIPTRRIPFMSIPGFSQNDLSSMAIKASMAYCGISSYSRYAESTSRESFAS